MYYLGIRDLNWLSIKNSGCLLCCMFLFACSTTTQVNTQRFSDKTYDTRFQHDHINEQFYNTYSSRIKTSIEQRVQPSDHQLMMSLLNRPVTEDQAMMLALKQERMNYTSSYSSSFTSYGVQIKGEKSNRNINHRATNFYSKLLLQDRNAVNIIAPH